MSVLWQAGSTDTFTLHPDTMATVAHKKRGQYPFHLTTKVIKEVDVSKSKKWKGYKRPL